MRAVGEERLTPDADFADEMEFCLLCRHCESVCPAGVQFGAMMEHTRGALEHSGNGGRLRRLLRWLGFRVVLPRRLVLRLAGSGLRALQVLGLDRLLDRLSDRGLRFLPRVPPLTRRKLLPRRTAATATPRGELAFLEGCVMPEFHARVNRATVRSLAQLGFGVRVPARLVCCGSLHAHNGDLAGARALAEQALAAFDAERGPDGAPLPIVVNSAGCGAHLRELHHLFEPTDPRHARAEALARRVRDYSEIVAPLLPTARGSKPPVPEPVTWDDPCHLCHAQGVRAEPRAVLEHLGGLARVELADSESCCGSAGIYSLLRPEASQAVFAKKLAAFRQSGARTLVTANPGCQMQWESGFARAGQEGRVVHMAELVDAALAAPESPRVP
jgi:glycolate oxidase iron-sulfur subunit